jgi:hypothetical protein
MVEPARYSKELIMLTAVSIIFGPAAAHVLVSAVTIALGAIIAASPRQAAKIWGSQRLANLAPERRASFVRWYRAFGILLCLAGLLFAADSIVFSTYHH